MYDEAWYSFVPETQSRKEDAANPRSKHKRRESLLKQSTDASQSIGQPAPLLEVYEQSLQSKDPPKATLARRAQSYSDFYHVVRSHIKRDVPPETSKMLECVDRSRETDPVLDFDLLYLDHENKILDASHDQYRLYGEQLTLSERHLDELLLGTTDALGLLTTLSESFKTVEAQTTAFQMQCDTLLSEQKRLKTLSRQLEDDLKYYSYLEPITRRLNAPGALRFAGDESFVEMLENLDMCIEYLAVHPEHRDAEVYLSRYRSLLVRALNLARVKFTDLVQETSTELDKAVAETSLTPTKLNHIYLKLSRKLDDEMGPYLTRLRNAVRKSDASSSLNGDFGYSAHGQFGPTVYEALKLSFADHVTTFVNSRRTYAVPILKLGFEKDVEADSKERSDNFMKFVRSCIADALDAAEEETRTYYNMLGPTTPSSDEYQQHSLSLFLSEGAAFEKHISDLTEEFWNIMEPLTRGQEVGILVDVSLYLSERHEDLTAYNEDDDDESRVGTSQSAEGEYVDLMKGAMTKQFLQKLNPKIHERLRELLLRQVTSYTPVLDEPVGEKKTNVSGPEDMGILNRIVQVPGQALSAGYSDAYSPVKAAIRLLILFKDISGTITNIDRGEDTTKGLGYEIIHEATQAVMKASNTIKTQGPMPYRPLDASVFVLKNLYILKAFILTYEISPQRVSLGIDLYHIFSVFAELQGRGELFNPSSYYRLLASGDLLPRVVENIHDARMELDGEMRTAIRALADAAIQLLATGPKSPDARFKLRQRVTAVLYQPHEQQVVESLFEEIERGAGEKGLTLFDR